jgi:hypothetical protein
MIGEAEGSNMRWDNPAFWDRVSVGACELCGERHVRKDGRCWECRLPVVGEEWQGVLHFQRVRVTAVNDTESVIWYGEIGSSQDRCGGFWNESRVPMADFLERFSRARQEAV